MNTYIHGHWARHGWTPWMDMAENLVLCFGQKHSIWFCAMSHSAENAFEQWAIAQNLSLRGATLENSSRTMDRCAEFGQALWAIVQNFHVMGYSLEARLKNGQQISCCRSRREICFRAMDHCAELLILGA
jgi:hypothetical protein